MRNRVVNWAVWLILACLLYFFENNTGTRIVLAGSLLLPLIPLLRRSLWGKDAVRRVPRSLPQARDTFAFRNGEDSGEVRTWLPGDPVNRIHWKLSAKRDELLVRTQAWDGTAEEAETQTVSEAGQQAEGRAKKRLFLLGPALMLLSLLLLFLIPSANRGMLALLNRLFEASEAVNAYAYERFAVPSGQPVALAAVLLSVLGLALLGMTLLSGSRWPSLGLMAGGVLFQVYFGLSFPAWVNVPILALFVLRFMKRPRERKAVLSLLAGVSVLTLAVLLICPGVDVSTEAASEAVRDRLSQAVGSLTGTFREQPAGENETRHVHTQSLTAGSREAQPDREYRLVTVKEEQISQPHWVNYLRIILLLLLTVALVILPFLPFLLLNRRRKKALDARKIFASGNVSEAVFAIFQHVAAWLEAMGYGEGNAPYAAWKAELSPGYAERFAACEKLFEEAAYSTHPMKEEQREQALALLSETEQALQQRADWKQRLRLKYRECLWV